MTAGKVRIPGGDEARPLGVLPLVRPVRALRPLLLATFYGLALLPLTYRPQVSDNVLSRYLAIDAVARHQTLIVDGTYLFQKLRPVDLVRFDGHFYSDKPPVLVVLASPIYAVLIRFGVTFTASILKFMVANLVLTWLVVGWSAAASLYWFRRMLQAVALPPAASDLLALAYGFGSQLLTYAVTFNNHAVAAACLTGAMTWTLLERPGGRARFDRFGVGLLAGLAATIDLPAGCLMVAGLGLLQAARARSIPLAFVAGAAGPLLLHAWLQSKVTGSPLPVEMYPEAFQYPGSYWSTPEGTFREYGSRSLFALELLVGPAGWLTLTPALAFGLVGLGIALARRGDPTRPMAVVILGSLVVLVAYYTWGVRRTDFAGQSFGVRHLLAITPPVSFFAAVALDRIRGWVAPCLFVGLTGIGVFYASFGVTYPWSRVEERELNSPSLRLAQRFVIYPYSRTRYRLAANPESGFGPHSPPTSKGRP